ncbi:MAG: dienelactone hydrolase family protein [Emticicia sp.]|nr:dienelactone hydrolase family protein [Emticicia sp.]
MQKIVLIVLLFCSFKSSSQIIDDSLLVEGHHRVFHFLKPAQPKASLVFVLHGSGAWGLQQQSKLGKFEETVASENIVLVYPDGYKRFWNECRKSAYFDANLENINEQAFFGGMIEYFKQKYQIDESKVFAVGTAGGGHMAQKLALTMPEKFRAVTAAMANLPAENNMDCESKEIAIPIMIVNGTEDVTNPYNGGEVINRNKVSLGFVRSTDETFAYWSKLAGYKKQPKMTPLPDTDPNDGKTIEKYTFKKRKKPEVTLLKVIGGKQDYPKDFDTYIEAWRFFKRQMK